MHCIVSKCIPCGAHGGRLFNSLTLKPGGHQLDEGNGCMEDVHHLGHPGSIPSSEPALSSIHPSDDAAISVEAPHQGNSRPPQQYVPPPRRHQVAKKTWVPSDCMRTLARRWNFREEGGICPLSRLYQNAAPELKDSAPPPPEPKTILTRNPPSVHSKQSGRPHAVP